jgi:peptidyl-prolyl cis-trans isomerase NIMA-interacting 1
LTPRYIKYKQAKITRSKEEAIAILGGYQSEVGTSAEKFGALARKHSDCSSHEHDGDLGRFGPGQMQKPFEEAAFGLRVGEISGIVETQSGVHLILRTE